MEGKRQRQYDAEFKKEVLKMTMEGKPIVDVARDLGISPERIYKWRRDEKLRIGAVAFASAGGKALTPEEELRALHQSRVDFAERNLRRRSGSATFKKSLGHLLERTSGSLSYEVIRYSGDEFSVEEMCRVLQISRSAWCEWNRREPEREEKRQARERLVEEIRKIHEESGRVYGSPRILQTLKGTGVDCAKHHVERIMREEGIRAETKRKKIRTTDSRHGYSIVPNILNRDFESSEPNRKWVSDITYIATGEGWLYLAAIMDLASRSIVGWATSADIDTALELLGEIRGVIFEDGIRVSDQSDRNAA